MKQTNQTKKIYSPKLLKQKAGESIRLDDKELVNKTLNPFYFSNRVLKAVFVINLDSHHINHINSISTIKPKHLENEKNHVDNIMKEMANM